MSYMTATTSAPGNTDTPVNIAATHVIDVANPKTLKHVPSPFRLGPLDHFAPTGAPIDVVYVYQKPVHVKTKDFIPIKRLRAAISHLLNYYPHLTGRLQVDPSNGVRSITKLGMGASLFEASYDQPLSPFPDPRFHQYQHLPGWSCDIDMLKLPRTGEALIAPWDPSFDDETGIQRGPLLLIQRTQFKCGSVAIGYRISHAVCAAEGCIHLYQDLCGIYRKLSRDDVGVLDLPPHIIPFGADRITTDDADQVHWATDHPPFGYIVSPQPGEALGGDADKHMKSTSTSDTAQDAHTPIVATYLHFSPEDLARLKVDATIPNDEDSWVSTFEALVAHLWQRTHQARVRLASYHAHRMMTGHPRGIPLSKDYLPTPSLWTSINFAHPSRLDLAGQNKGMGKSHYFPNAILPVFFTAPEDDVLLEDAFDLWDAPLWQVAKLIHERMRHPETTSIEYALAVANWMCDLPDKRLAKFDFNLFGEWCFVNTDWSKYELYGERTALDIRAILAAPPLTKASNFDGFTTFLKARERGREVHWLAGGIDVMLTMNEAASKYWDGWLEDLGR
ncbi:hypothetical protein N0V85_007918 [Neurospora sp. IMI 360204]|nr:hypothetical protein N0V85_007918 [Neurospora sp. IMI 360204]